MKINFILQIRTESKEKARLIRSALEPDNKISPPMSIISRVNGERVIYTIKSVNKIETAISTFNDILSSIKATEEVLNLKKE